MICDLQKIKILYYHWRKGEDKHPPPLLVLEINNHYETVPTRTSIGISRSSGFCMLCIHFFPSHHLDALAEQIHQVAGRWPNQSRQMIYDIPPAASSTPINTLRESIVKMRICKLVVLFCNILFILTLRTSTISLKIVNPHAAACCLQLEYGTVN